MTASPASGQLIAAKYRLLRRIGKGGMGAVYLAENVDLGRKVAIKLLHEESADDPETVARFRQEARAAAAIGHPGIVDVLDLGHTEDGAVFIVMERLRGASLRALLDGGPLDPEPCAAILCQLLDALQAAHERGIIHRDLKPDNVFIAVEPPPPRVKILDFGISKLVSAQQQGVQTATGAVLGTPAYMAPEQATSDRALGPAADLYAVGAIAYQMLSGRPPFTGHTWARLLLKVVEEEPEPLAKLRGDLPLPLVALVMRLLAKAPADRPPGARETREALLVALELTEARVSEIGAELADALPPAEEDDDEAIDALAATAAPAAAALAPTAASAPARAPAASGAADGDADALAATAAQGESPPPAAATPIESPPPVADTPIGSPLPIPPSSGAARAGPRRWLLWLGLVVGAGLVFLALPFIGGRPPPEVPRPPLAPPPRPNAAPAAAKGPQDAGVERTPRADARRPAARKRSRRGPKGPREPRKPGADRQTPRAADGGITRHNPFAR